MPLLSRIVGIDALELLPLDDHPGCHSKHNPTDEAAKMDICRAMVVAQLVEQLLPSPEICGSNPTVSKSHDYLLAVLLFDILPKTDTNTI